MQVYSLPKKEPDTAYIGVNDRDKAWHDLYKLKISTGEKTLVRKNTEKIAAWIFDRSGQLRLAAHVADNGDQEILRIDTNAALRLKGVIYVLTHLHRPTVPDVAQAYHDDVAPEGGSPFRPLYDCNIVFNVQPVAVVV